MTRSPAVPDWETEFQRWLEPFLGCLGHKARQQWFPVYLRGQLSAICRRCATTMAREMVPEDEEQLHHFVSTSPWEGAPLEAELVRSVNRLVGGPDSFLIIDDTALVKKGTESVGVARQYCGELGKKANCQSLVSLMLARGEVPVPIALRLFLPESWDRDERRRGKCGVPQEIRHLPKWRIALEELDRAMASGAQFGEVLADAGYGMCGEFRQGLTERRDGAPPDAERERASAQAPRTVLAERARESDDREFGAADVPERQLAQGNERAFAGEVRGRARAGGGRRQEQGRQARSGRKRLADLRGAGERRTQILSLEPSALRNAPEARGLGEVALVLRAGPSANETGVGTEPLRRAFVVWPASSLPAHDDLVRLSSAPAAEG